MSEPAYGRPLREADADADPLRQFSAWFDEARSWGLRAPETMGVATASADAVPSVRMVLLKHYDERGFVFYTHYDSRKGAELAANPRAALLFYWEALGRQVRIEGPVAPVSAAESERYVRSRPRGSQLSALASPQSQPVPSREALEARVAEVAERYGQRELPVPGRWGGFRVVAERYEFWQHREDRLHDRLLYTPDRAAASAQAWRMQRLAP